MATHRQCKSYAPVVPNVACNESLAVENSRGGANISAIVAVLIDPTTYASAVISYEAMRQDWKTSQGRRCRTPACDALSASQEADTHPLVVERIAFASILTYRNSADHVRQAVSPASTAMCRRGISQLTAK